MRLITTKAILWMLAGMGLTIIVLRVLHGPGSVVALSDAIPWGLWKGGGVVALVPIGGAGFTLAAMVYVFGWTRYRVLARGAVLLGLMCYASVVVGLTVDIGIWWRIVFPVIFWQLHSPLFEIAWCIMLYLGVLCVEFSAAVFESLRWTHLLKLVKKVSLLFVIAGIALSTLHQSSLGTLFLATPYRLHPLWYTDWLPFQFFVTAIGLGCLTIIWVTLVTHWLFKAEPPMHALTGLSKIGGCVLGFYLILKFGEIAASGELPKLATLTADTANFWIENLLGAVIPVVLLAFRSVRQNPRGLVWVSTSSILGIGLNRINVAGLATVSALHEPYLPSLTEWAVSLGILAMAGLVYLFCVEHFRVFESLSLAEVARAHAPAPIDHARWQSTYFRMPLSQARLFSGVFVFSVGVTLGMAPDPAIFGLRPEPTPTHHARVVTIVTTPRPNLPGNLYAIPETRAPARDSSRVPMLLLDADRNGSYVLFDHQKHLADQTQEGACQTCHHMNLPYETASRCHACHRDMFEPTELFQHDAHVQHLGGNAGCTRCHEVPTAPKTRTHTPACEHCHHHMRLPGTLVEIPRQEQTTLAVGYRDAMHQLCIGCHERKQSQLEPPDPDFSRCNHCHRDLPALNQDAWEKKL